MADIGDKLRSAREAKGLSIADIEKATKIQGRYLTAIEQNDFDKLPGDFYVRAFIRQYAQIVGLDGKELLSEYHQDLPSSKPDEYVENSIDNKSEEVRETTDNKRNLWKNYLPRIAVILGVIIVILVVYVLYARLSAGGQNNNNANSNVTVSSQKSSSSKKKAKAVVKKAAVKITQVGNNEYRVTGLTTNRHLVVKAGNQTITASVAVNGTINWQQNLAASAKHTMNLPKDAKTVVVNLGNDNGTSVKIGGKRVPYVPTGSSLSLRLLIGKKQKTAKTKTTTNTGSTNNSSNSNSSSSTNNNSGNTGSAGRSSNQSRNNNPQNNQRQSSQRQTQRSNTQSSTSQNNNAQNNTQNNSKQNQQSSSSTTTTSTGSTGD